MSTINFRQAKKDALRRRKRAQGDANAAKHGQSKAQKDAQSRLKVLTARRHEEHKREPDADKDPDA